MRHQRIFSFIFAGIYFSISHGRMCRDICKPDHVEKGGHSSLTLIFRPLPMANNADIAFLTWPYIQMHIKYVMELHSCPKHMTCRIVFTIKFIILNYLSLGNSRKYSGHKIYLLQALFTYLRTPRMTIICFLSLEWICYAKIID